MSQKSQPIDYQGVPCIFRGLRFKFGENVLTIREIQGNVAIADDGKTGINMKREDGIWLFDGKYKL